MNEQQSTEVKENEITFVLEEKPQRRFSGLCSNITEIPMNLTRDAEKYMKDLKTRWKAVQLHSLPSWLKDNQYLINNHRPAMPSFMECFKSIFRIHTETVNIWTHLLGCFTFLPIGICILIDPYDSFSWQDQCVFSIFFIGAILCMLCSWIFHTVYCHSQKIGLLFNKLDYCGIAFLTVGSFVPWLYYTFYCNIPLMIFYNCLIFMLGILVIVVSMFNKFSLPVYRPVRAALFVALGLSGLIPTFHYVIENGFWDAIEKKSLAWLGLMAVLYITGATIYACRVPERLFPGKFDIVFQSHQIFHVFVIAGAFVHYHGLKQLAIYTLTQNDCPGPIVYVNN